MSKYIAAVCVLTGIALTLSIIDSHSTGAGEATDAVNATRGAAHRIYAAGIVEGATRDIEIRAEQVGLVRAVPVKAGAWVEANDVLVRLDSDAQRQETASAKARLELAQAELERLRNGARPEEREETHALVRSAQARLDQTSRNLQRLRDLQSSRAATQQDVDDQQSLVDATRAELDAAEARAKQIEAPAREDEVAAAEARVSAAQAEVNYSNIRLAKYEVRAPHCGRVLDVHVVAGELTGPQAAEPIIVLSDTSKIRVRAFVEELDAAAVRSGMTARITSDALHGRSFSGRVIAMNPYMKSKTLLSAHPNQLYDTKTREVLLEMSDMANAIVGQPVDVEFSVQSQSDAAPTAADQGSKANDEE
jgi:multidrug resistance efflux pump